MNLREFLKRDNLDEMQKQTLLKIESRGFWGLWMLLLAALRFGVVKLEQVRTAALFLTGIFPLLFVPAAAGVMDLWADLQAMLVPVLLALIPITILVMTVSGCVTQRLAERKEKKQ